MLSKLGEAHEQAITLKAQVHYAESQAEKMGAHLEQVEVSKLYELVMHRSLSRLTFRSCSATRDYTVLLPCYCTIGKGLSSDSRQLQEKATGECDSKKFVDVQGWGPASYK